MNLKEILSIIIPSFISLVTLLIIIYNLISEIIFKRDHTKWYEDKYIKGESGFPDYCKDIYGTFLYEQNLKK